MLHGDISNKGAVLIAFRLDNFLLQYKQEGILNTIANKMWDINKRATINPKVVQALNFVYKYTDYSPILIMDSQYYTKGLEEYLVSNYIPYSRLLKVNSRNQIMSMLITKEIEYYVDDHILEWYQYTPKGKSMLTLEEFNKDRKSVV